ncbi:hypothetical protein [Nonomuraea angiospora]
MSTHRMYESADVMRLLASLHDVANVRPGADYRELAERLAIVRVATKGIVARSTATGPIAELWNWVQFHTRYVRSEIERLSARAGSGRCLWRGGPKLDRAAEEEYRREQADYD